MWMDIHIHPFTFTYLYSISIFGSSESMHKLLRWLSVYPQASWGTTVAETCMVSRPWVMPCARASQLEIRQTQRLGST